MAKRIMITDDALFMRVTLKNILTQNGLEVVAEASNGREAVELYEQHKPDLVFMDITMPEMDGLGGAQSHPRQGPEREGRDVYRDGTEANRRGGDSGRREGLHR
jgi:two-component system chemotaxis response regulator CheY